MTATHPLYALAKVPHGTCDAYTLTAQRATGNTDPNLTCDIIAAVEQRIADDTVRRILSGSTTNTQWATAVHHLDGTVRHTPAANEEHAHLIAAGINIHVASLNEPSRRENGVGHAEVVTRDVWQLRDGSTVTGRWVAAGPRQPEGETR